MKYHKVKPKTILYAILLLMCYVGSVKADYQPGQGQSSYITSEVQKKRVFITFERLRPLWTFIKLLAITAMLMSGFESVNKFESLNENNYKWWKPNSKQIHRATRNLYQGWRCAHPLIKEVLDE
ncbi:MAG: hypothetical protein ACPGC9_00995 [Cytophagales bacterium]